MTTQTIAIKTFAGLLANEELPPDKLEILLQILAEIAPTAPRFQPNTAELLDMESEHSPAFRALPPDGQAFACAVLSMPLFFFTIPEREDDALSWIQENL
jgi:hypothetical protein